jgi:hypothetical protein
LKMICNTATRCIQAPKHKCDHQENHIYMSNCSQVCMEGAVCIPVPESTVKEKPVQEQPMFKNDTGVRWPLWLFAVACETKLKKHDGDWGDVWKTCDADLLHGKLFEELGEWIKTGQVDRKELVDVANMCMMLWYRSRMAEGVVDE